MKKYISVFFVFLLLATLCIPCFAAESEPPLVVDGAGILDHEEESRLQSKLEKISEGQKLNVAVVTVKSIGGRKIADYADDYFDKNGYGFENTNDGVLLLVAMKEREWYITTAGYGIKAFTDAGIDYIGDKLASHLSDGEYCIGFEVYADLADDFITQARNGSPYDRGNLPKGDFPTALFVFISAAVGIVISFAVMSITAGKLKTVRSKAGATDYVRDGSFELTESRDLFLYRNISRVKIYDENSGGGGSSTHVSSSGVSHGGGGGKF